MATSVVEISGGRIALVDSEDYARVSAHRWTATVRGKDLVYAVTTIVGDSGKRTLHYLHRFIMVPEPGQVVDHVSGDGLDCRKGNMRLCSQAENIRNQRVFVKGSSGFKGVTAHRNTGKWVARITLGYKNKYLGIFDTAESAAQAYDTAAKVIHGEFARTNGVQNGN